MEKNGHDHPAASHRLGPHPLLLAGCCHCRNLPAGERSNRAALQPGAILAALLTLLVTMATSLTTFVWELRVATSSAALISQESVMAGRIVDRELSHILKPGFIAPQHDAPGTPLPSFLPWIDGLWIVGVILLSLRSLGGWWLIQRLRVSAKAQAPDNVMAYLRGL